MGKPRLQTLLEGLKRKTLSAKADSTVAIYGRSALRFIEFCQENSLLHLPATSLTTALFLESLSEQGASVSALAQALAGIAWYHKSAGEIDPSTSAVVQNVLSASKRNAPAVMHTVPATKEHLKYMVASAGKKPSLLPNRRTLALAVVVAFSGCFHLDDVISLNREHFQINSDSVEIFLPRAKTDQFRAGNKKFIPEASNPELCPVKILRTWFASGAVGTDPSSPAFPMITNKKKPASTTAFRENLQILLEGAKLPKITPHSFRAGFATAAINNGAEASDIREFGLWASDTSLQRYASRAKGKKLATGRKAGL